MRNKRIYISSPYSSVISDRHGDLKVAILKYLETQGMEPQHFLESGIPAGWGWNFAAANDVMRRCHGAVILAFPRWQFTSGDKNYSMVTEYNHFEGALASAHRLPLLVLADRSVEERGIVWTGGGVPITFIPDDAGPAWLESPTFIHRFGIWKRDVNERKDVFLGYCSKAKPVAQEIYIYLKDVLKASVHDWAMDFHSGGTILEEIERAEKLCTCGIFLFTADDQAKSSGTEHATPRDNIIFETGYFVNAKGKERTLIIREDGVKMPADLGGNIYLRLGKDRKVAVLHDQLRRFITERL
jgi:Predicted nucleotide-binding protein containing TIR-like domain